MEYNIINDYINFVSSKFLDFFKFILRNHYRKNICMIFIDKYIEVRYYNETNYITEKDFINRINKELVDLTEKIADDDTLDDIPTDTSTEFNPLPVSGDEDVDWQTSVPEGDEGKWFVDMYAVTVGRDATFTYSYSRVLHLGSVTINQSDYDKR